MTKSLFFFTVFLLTTTISFSQYTLEIEISGIRNNTGTIMLQLLNEDESVSDQEMSAIKENTCSIAFKNIKPGKYAVRFFHDENMNGELDKDKLGIPVEGYGFSNNAYGMSGPKPYRDWLFEIKTDKKLNLKIKY